MDISLSSSLKQEQNLSPQMLQSLALLPMSVMELQTYIQSAIESNPALEIPETEFDPVLPGSSSSRDEDSFDDSNASDYEMLSYGHDSDASDRKEMAIENSSGNGETLSQHLLSQLGVCDISDSMYRIGEMLIGNLDENGFFILPLIQLFENEKFKKEDIDKTVELVQSFDPYGICVQDFRQSLILQAKCSGMKKTDLETFSALVNNHLDKIKAGKNRDVAAMLHISEEDLNTFLCIMKSFTPFPGRNFDSRNDDYVVPEFSIRMKNGSLVLEMNKSNLPDIHLSEEFTSLAKSVCGPQAKETSAYIRESVNQAKNLISQVDMRYKTLFSCAKALMEIQKEFFIYGTRFLKPMTLQDIAAIIGVHETTMSRLSQSKWVDTDWGLFPLKYFFTQGVSTSDDCSAVSRNAVKEMIADILKDDPKLSDQKISDKLAQQGIKCARRTVSKYRSELNIDSSYSR